MSCARSANNFNKKKGKEMPRNKQQARRHKQQASSHKLETLINLIHDYWALDNGYKTQASSHKLRTQRIHLRQNVARYNASDYKDSSSKPQAS